MNNRPMANGKNTNQKYIFGMENKNYIPGGNISKAKDESDTSAQYAHLDFFDDEDDEIDFDKDDLYDDLNEAFYDVLYSDEDVLEEEYVDLETGDEILNNALIIGGDYSAISDSNIHDMVNEALDDEEILELVGNAVNNEDSLSRLIKNNETLSNLKDSVIHGIVELRGLVPLSELENDNTPEYLEDNLTELYDGTCEQYGEYDDRDESEDLAKAIDDQGITSTYREFENMERGSGWGGTTVTPYIVSFKNNEGKTMDVSYSMGVGLSDENPTTFGVLQSMVQDTRLIEDYGYPVSPQQVSEEYGYDSETQKKDAYMIARGINDTHKKLEGFFGKNYHNKI